MSTHDSLSLREIEPEIFHGAQPSPIADHYFNIGPLNPARRMRLMLSRAKSSACQDLMQRSEQKEASNASQADKAIDLAIPPFHNTMRMSGCGLLE